MSSDKCKKTVLLTGGCGFIGSFIAEYLVENNINTLVITRNIKRCWRISDKQKFRFIEGNLSDKNLIKNIFEEYEPEIVIHSAWNGVTGKFRNKTSQVDNLIHTQNLLEIAGKYRIKLFIGFGSQSEYGVYNKRISEDFLTKPNSLYGIYKLVSGLIGFIYAKKYGFRYAWLRLFSTFGPKDDDYYIIPYTIKSFLMNRPPELTLCNQKWDYLYVKDIAKLIWKIMIKEDYFCDIYNLCTGEPKLLKDIILTIKEIIGTSINPFFGAVPYRKNGLYHLEGDNTKFIETFGWIELTDFKKAISETIDWYRKRYESNIRIEQDLV